MKDWANCESNVLLFDPTWGTHRAGMKLCCFTMVANSGQTVVLAFALIADEKTDSILWCFRAFAAHFKKAPSCFFTDDAAAIATAFASLHDAGTWSGTVHLLCTYHLAKNFFKHVKPVVREPKEWQKLNSWFWKFAKFSDNRLDVGTEWAAFITHFDNVARGPSKADVIVWLEELFSRRKQWMATITWSFTTWGVHSTQRAEAVHAALKGRKLKNLSAVALVQEMTEYNEQSRLKKGVDDVRKQLRSLAGLYAVPRFLQSLQTALTPYAYDLVLAQFSLSVTYKSTPYDDDGRFLVLPASRVSLTSATQWNVSLQQAAPRWSWLLLCEAPISNYADLDHIHEMRENGRGRKRTVRKGPAAGGPTATAKRSKP